MSPTDTRGAQRTRHPGVKRLRDGRWLVKRSYVDQRTGARRWRKRVVEGTRDEAVAARALLLEATPTAPRTRPRFAPFAGAWLEAHRGKLQGSTAERYAGDVSHLVQAFGGWWVDAISAEDVERWQQRMRGGGFAPATVNGAHRTLRLVLEVARKRGHMSGNAARDVPALSEGRTGGARGRSLSVDELRRLIRAARGAGATGRAVLVLCWTGVRAGELLALQWGDLGRGELEVTRSVWRGKTKPTKTDDPRRITVPRPLAAVLTAQRQELVRRQHPGLASGLMFPAAPRQAASGATRRKGEASWFMSQSTIRDALGELCEAAKVPRVTPHALRRTFEDLLREQGVDKMVRRAVAGWRSEKAQGIYATVSRAERDGAAAALVRVLSGKRG